MKELQRCIHALLMVLIAATMGYSKNTTIFPGVPLEGTNFAPEKTQPNNLFIYNWPAEEQARHPGTVTAIEYCYERVQSMPTNMPIFTLILLRPDSGGYRMTYTKDVVALNSSTPCSNRVGIITCCERQLLDEQVQSSQLLVPSESMAFGIFTQTRDEAILAFRNGEVQNTAGYQTVISSDDIRRQFISVSLNNIITVEYRMFNFVIMGLADVNSTKNSTAGGANTINQPTEEEDELISYSDSGKLIPVIAISVFINVLLFITIAATWSYMCFKAKTLQMDKDLLMKLRDKTHPGEVEQPMYEDIRNLTNAGNPPTILTTNPSYQSSNVQTEHVYD